MKTVSGTKEWAASNENIQTGCEHDCKYCYAKCMALRFGRATVDSWKEPILADHKLRKGFSRRSGRIMFPTTHDITVGNVKECTRSLRRMLAAGNEVLIVSKPHVECIRYMCGELTDYKTSILFRFTVGSADNDVLSFWEPGAPSFEERLESLILACELGFETSVSCEPMLDANIVTVVSDIVEYVTDFIWLGKANRMRQITALNSPGDPEVRRRVDELIGMQNDDAIKALYEQFKDHPKVKWKESIKKVVGLDIPTEAGLDI